jgi:hypothetical protein
MKFEIGILIFAPLSILGCYHNGNLPASAQIEKTQAIYIGLLETNENANALAPDSARQGQIDSVLGAFGTSRKELLASLADYRSNPERWKDFFEGVVNRIEQKQDSARGTPTRK